MPPDSSSATSLPELELAIFAAELPYDRIPGGSKEAFDRLAIDFVSVAIAGLRDTECTRAANAFGGLSDFGSNPSASAFALGTCAHWFDWDDTDDASHVHGGAVIFPALLASYPTKMPSESRPRGPAFVAAAIAGYDIACRVGAHLKDHGPRGWMPTGSGGTVGAAAAASRLAGFDAPEILSTMGIAAANAGISRQALADRANSKGVLTGIAAKTAVDALLLCKTGVEGAPNFLNGAYGLCALEAQGVAMKSPRDLGGDFRIERVSVKPYPCCRSAHAVIDGLLEFRHDSPAAAARIAGVEVSAPPGVFERCGGAFHVGENARLSAQFSIPYTAAVALRKGGVGLEEFEAGIVSKNASAWRDLIEAIRVRRDPDETADVLAPVRLRLLADDVVIADLTVSVLKGDPRRPLTAAEQNEKLRNAAKWVLSEAEIAEVANLVRGLQRDGPEELIRWLHPRFAARARAVGA